jgi:hypothetical protein
MPSGTGQRAWRARDRDWAFWIDVIAIRRSSTDAYTAGDEIYTAVLPPSTGRIAPWTKLARSVARNTIASAISSGAAGRPVGACAASCCSASPIAAVPSVRVGPGLTAFTRTPLGPYSVAHALVSRLMAALLDP